MMNDTFYGPLYPINKMFAEMDKKKCDFWGVTCHQEYIDYYSSSSQKLPAYIQSYFMGFRKKIFQSDTFQDYWNQFDSTNWLFSDVLNRHEKYFTSAMEQAGFSWDTYVHAIEYDAKNPEDNFIQYYYIAYQLIKDYGCPFIKKKNFISKHLTANPGELGNDTSKAFLFIKKNTNYPIDMIWENLLRLYDVNDIRRALNLNYIISDNFVSNIVNRDKTIAFVCANEPLTIQQKHYIQLLKTHMKVIEGQTIQEKNAEKIIDKLFGMEAEWEYALCLADIKHADGTETDLHKYSAVEEQWGNLAGKDTYTAEIVKLFSENSRLGVLLAPCGIYGADFGNETNVKLRYCMALWCRKDIFQRLKNKVIAFASEPSAVFVEKLRDDFAKTAQRMGYYTAVGMKNSYASMAYTNMDEMLRQIIKHTKNRYEFEDFGSYLDGTMLLFCEKFPQIYVYGAGENGGRAASLIIKKGYHFSGFIISDDQPDLMEKYGHPVYQLSKLGEPELYAGIVVAVANKKFQAEIMQQLRQKGFKNIYLLDT